MRLLLAIWFPSFAVASASIKLPALLSNQMVLFKSAQTPLWGTADPGEKVTVVLGTLCLFDKPMNTRQISRGDHESLP